MEGMTFDELRKRQRTYIVFYHIEHRAHRGMLEMFNGASVLQQTIWNWKKTRHGHFFEGVDVTFTDSGLQITFTTHLDTAMVREVITGLVEPFMDARTTLPRIRPSIQAFGGGK